MSDFRYKRYSTIMAGFGRRAYNRATRTFVDAPSAVAGIIDTTSVAWPKTRADFIDGPSQRWNNWKRLRELNGLPPLTAQAVRAVLRKAGHRKAEYHKSGQVRGWGSWSSGFHVSNDDFGRVVVEHRQSHWGKQEAAEAALLTYVEALTVAGINAQNVGGQATA